MDSSELRNEQQANAEEHSQLPTAAPEEKLDEASGQSEVEQLCSSFKASLVSREEQARRPELHGSVIIKSKAAEHYTNGKEAMEKSQYEKAVICFSKAITLQPEQTRLYASQGEAYLQLCDFQSAAACYKWAQLLEPGGFSGRLASVYYLQGLCLSDRGLHREAMEAFSRAAEMKPECKAYKIKNLTAAGRHADCLKLVNDWIVSDGPTSELYVLRAQLHKVLNQTSRCYEDVKAALVLNPTCPEATALLQQLQRVSEQAREKAVDRFLNGQLPEARCIINVALENCPQDGRLYLFRGTLSRLLKDFTAAKEDLIRAVELSVEKDAGGQAEARENDEGDSLREEAHFQLVLIYNDYSIECFSKGHYAEAILLLNEAIKKEKGQAGLYLNRGDCFFKQGDWCYALADYQQAEEMMLPNDPAICLRLTVLYNNLGYLHFQDGHFQEAADNFSLAIRYNPTASQCYENRAKAFRKLLNFTGAREDVICMLILDSTSEELPPMFMHLFPGYSVSDVLSSPEGKKVRAQLMGNIQAHNVSPDISSQQRLSEKLQQMTLSGEITESRSPEAREKLKLCVNEHEVSP